jgi:hypothetical protein
VLVDVVVLEPEVLVVGPPPLVDAASPKPNPARATTEIIIVVLRSHDCASRTPAGLPGFNADESASALVVQSASDVAKQIAAFISNPRKHTAETLDQSSGSRNVGTHSLATALKWALRILVRCVSGLTIPQPMTVCYNSEVAGCVSVAIILASWSQPHWDWVSKPGKHFRGVPGFLFR